MKAFAYYHPRSLEDAVSALTVQGRECKPIAAGTDLIGEIKNGCLAPDRLVNLKALPGLDRIAGGAPLRIGALVRLADLAGNADVRKNYPGLAEAAEAIGSPQLRNMGTVGGNLCQRPRCWYYRGEEYPCLRKGGDTCFAVDGRDKYHAILNGGPCFIVHPSDLAPMLMAYDAAVTVQGPKGSREVKLDEFFILPAEDPTRENILQPGELVTQVTVPSPVGKGVYLKFKERESRDFALVSAAVVLAMQGKSCRRAAVVLGGVAPAPFRAKAAEAALAGSQLDLRTVEQAAEAALAEAQPMKENAYKIQLAKTILKRAVLRAAGVEV